jgi:hypothetical protein
MFDTGSSDFSMDSDSSSSGGDFMDKYISETGAKPLQVDSDAPKAPKQDSEPSIPDMASLFNDDPKPQSKPQQPWADQSSSSASSNMDNLFGGSFGFDAPAKAAASFDFDAPAKPARHVDTDSHTDDMTNLFSGRSSDSSASSDAASSNSDSVSGWPWDTHAKKKQSEEHHSRDLWGSNSDSDTSSGSSSNDMENLFGGSSSGSSDSGSSHSMFSDWSSNDFGAKSGASQPATAPQQQDEAPQRSADSPIQGPTQRESSISGATATDQVVDVRLSSELQQSLLQARNAETKMLQRFRGVSN